MKRLEQNKQLINTAVAANAQPRQRGKQTILPTGQRRDALGLQVLVGDAHRRNSSYVVWAKIWELSRRPVSTITNKVVRVGLMPLG